MRILLVIFVLIFNTDLHAKIKAEGLSLGLGNLTQFVQDIQTENNGSELNIWDTNLYLEVNLELKSDKYKNWGLYPQFGLLFPQSGRHDKINKLSLFTLLNLGYLWKDFTFRLGMGLFFTRISSDGGTQELNNGGEISTFYLPEKTSTARNLITNLGLEHRLHRLWSTRFEFIGYNLEDSADRALSYTISFHYHFGNIFDPNYWKRK